jgi:hypothetical protein
LKEEPEPVVVDGNLYRVEVGRDAAGRSTLGGRRPFVRSVGILDVRS